MLRKKIDELEPGMILSREVRDESDRLLVAKGTELSDALISRLSQIGVSLVYVEGEGAEEEEPDSPLSGRELEDIETRVDKKFSKFADNEVMSHIAVCAKRFLKRKAKKEIQ